MKIDLSRYEGRTPGEWSADARPEKNWAEVIVGEDVAILRADSPVTSADRANVRLAADAPKLLDELLAVMREVLRLRTENTQLRRQRAAA